MGEQGCTHIDSESVAPLSCEDGGKEYGLDAPNAILNRYSHIGFRLAYCKE